VKLQYLKQCILEGVRMYPAGLGTMRTLTKTAAIDGVTLEKDTIVVIYSLSCNYNPKYWPEPFKFDPERWTKEKEAARPKGAFFSFGNGPRDCIGKSMAVDSAIIVLGSLLKRYSFELKPGYVFSFHTAWVAKPRNDLLVYVKRR